MERAVLMTDREVIRAEDLVIDRRSNPKAVTVDPEGRIFVVLPPEGLSLELVEREFIRAALRQSKGNVSRAASLLRMSRDTLRYRVAKYELDQEDAK